MTPPFRIPVKFSYFGSQMIREMKTLRKNYSRFFIVIALTQLLNWNLPAQTWENIDTPVPTNLILYDISFPAGQSNIGFVAGSNLTYNGKGKILKTVDKGSTWEIIYENETAGTGFTSIFFLTAEVGWAGSMGGPLFSTPDGGTTWTPVDFDPTTDQGEVSDIAFWDAQHGALSTLWGGMYYTTDGGASWDGAGQNFFAAQDIAYAGANTIFAVGGSQDIYRSTDGGQNWYFNYSGPSNFAVNLGVHFSDASNGLVTSEEGQVFVTHDGGTSWSPYIVPDQYGLMRGAFVFNENDMYATGTPGQVYRSVNGGVNWTPDSPVDPNPSYYKIVFTPDGTGFVCGSGASGGTILRKLATAALNTAVDTAFNVTCFGAADGAISITVSGGTPPYSYAWSNGQTNEDLTGLTAGDYSCIITDDNGTTTTTGTITITEPTAIAMETSVIDVTGPDTYDGSIDLTITGGTPPYSFLWDNGATTEDLQGLDDGFYCVTATDTNGCTQVACATVWWESSSREIEDLLSFHVFPNPVSGRDIFVDARFSVAKDISLSLVNAIGQEVRSSEFINTSSLQTSIDTGDLSKGIYFLRVTSLNDGRVITKQIEKR